MKKDNLIQTRRLLRLDAVPRWTVIYTIQKQSVAEHIYRAMVVARALHREGVFPEIVPLDELLEELLGHEEDEALTGDVPSTHKHGAGLEVDLTHDIDYAVRIVDITEALMYISREMVLGNTTVKNVGDQLNAKLWSTVYSLPDHWGEGAYLKLVHFVNDMLAKFHPSMEGMINEDGAFEVQTK